jgi:hypothetical protein
MDDQLQQLIELQKEQNQLLKRYLWRLRFSLLSLLLLTTITAIGLGVFVYREETRVNAPIPTTAGASGFIDVVDATELFISTQPQN